MKVIGAGFGRTGTASLADALAHLGFGPCYHMFDVVEKPERMRPWLTAAEGGPVDWNEVFAGFESTVDWPGAAFWREITACYPEAKVVLTVRDPQRWYDSAAGTIFKQALRNGGPGRRVALRLLAKASPNFGTFLSMTDVAIMKRVFDGRFADRSAAVATFIRHIAEVRAEVPEDRLLVYDVADGWPPLCEFLGVAVPERPFPRGNDASTFAREDRRRMSRLILSRP